MEGIQIVSPQEMKKLEMGGNHERYMQEAGNRVAEAAMAYVREHGLAKEITLLVGKGNNGGDAFAAGVHLLKSGYQVHAYCLYSEGSALNQKFRELFRKEGGCFEERLGGLIVDGLLGTGFEGKVEKKIAALIDRANQSGLPVIAIDLPSGLNGETGEVGEAVIAATETVALGLPKIGFFINGGWNYVGTLRIVDFGLDKEEVAEVEAYLPGQLELPKMARTRHKYQAGYVIGVAGSAEFPGAAKLAGLAALRTGAGMVRIYHSEEIGPVPMELISVEWDLACWTAALKKARAVFVGPGLGKQSSWLKKNLKTIPLPCVIDADALQFGWTYPRHAILTPHRGEVLRLLGLKKAVKDQDLFENVGRFCVKNELYVVLKGAPTVIFGPQGKPVIVPYGDPGMATAGAGDVLTGVIAGLLAQGCQPHAAAVLGVSLHAIAGEEGAKAKTSYSLIASDLIEFMPAAFQRLKSGGI